MKTMMALASMFLGLSLGCGAGGEGEPLPDESAAEDIGQAEQEVNTPCFQDCQCPLTERCDLTRYYCESYAVWGGDTSPIKCVNDCQCQTWYSPGYYCNMDSGSYGHCAVRPW